MNEEKNDDPQYAVVMRIKALGALLVMLMLWFIPFYLGAKRIALWPIAQEYNNYFNALKLCIDIIKEGE